MKNYAKSLSTWFRNHGGQGSRTGTYICGCGAIVFATDRKAKRHHPPGHKKLKKANESPTGQSK